MVLHYWPIVKLDPDPYWSVKLDRDLHSSQNSGASQAQNGGQWMFSIEQCCGFMTFWGISGSGSGSADSCL
jgi:hypothetical protein